MELIAVSTNNLSRSTLKGLGPASSGGLTHRIYADASAQRTQTLAGESCSPSTAERIGFVVPGGKVGSQQSAMDR